MAKQQTNKSQITNSNNKQQTKPRILSLSKEINPLNPLIRGKTTNKQINKQTNQQLTINNKQINNKQQTKPYLPEPAEGKKIPLIP